MNKKLLTAAIGAALVAGPMLAQADVKVYGKVHVSVDFVNPGSLGAAGDPASRKNTHVSSNASRWGLDISEKLGGGMTAIAKLEQEIDASGETASQNPRNRYVGMKGGFGQIIAGVMDTPLKEVSRSLELFPEYVGDMRNLVRQNGSVGGTTASLGWDERFNNAVRYDSPSMNGFVFNYLYSADNRSTTAVNSSDDNRFRADSFGVKYSKGPLYVAFAHETHRMGLADGAQQNEKGNRLGASYNFGAFKLNAMYQRIQNIGGTPSGATAVNRNSYALGGAYTAGNNVFKVQYVKANAINATSAGASGADTGAKSWTVGWDHLFSKTTKAYIAYAKTDNENSANFVVNGNGHSDTMTPQVGGDPSAWSIGMIVDF